MATDFIDLFARQYRRFMGTTYPSGGSWNVGDLCMNEAPASGAPWGWVCITAGTPGTWAPVASIQASGVTAISAAGNVAPTAGLVAVGTGGFNITLTAPTAVQDGAVINIVNANASAVTLVAGAGTTLFAGSAVIGANSQGQVQVAYPNLYRIA